MGRLSELDEVERQGLVPEKQAPEREPWEVAWEEWWERSKHIPFEGGTSLLERMFHDGYEAGAADTRAELQAAVREALPAEDPQGGFWRCTGCSRDFKGDPGEIHFKEDGGGWWGTWCGPVVKVEKEEA